jgi:hypothetical protein
MMAPASLGLAATPSVREALIIVPVDAPAQPFGPSMSYARVNELVFIQKPASAVMD